MSATDGLLPAYAGYAAASNENRQSQLPFPADETLFLRVQAGDEGALGVLFDRYAASVLRIGCRVLRDFGEAQELVQEVFLHIFQKSCLFDSTRGSVRAWLFQTAYHCAFNRREYLQNRRFYDNKNLADFTGLMKSSSNVEYEAQLSECEAILRDAFAKLNPKQRTTLNLFFFDGYTLREISETLHEPLANVRHYYYRGLARLKDSVETNPLCREA